MNRTIQSSGSLRSQSASDFVALARGALIVFLSFALSVSVAHAGKSKGAAMVMDANTGRILYSDSGDALRHPASLTKMMTIYMVFDLIESGRLSYDTLIKISKTAAAQPPSKLGLKPGRKIKLIHAIKSLVTKSANDIAVAIAEHIGGSERNFARLMTAKARSLGMTRTVFRNASGLPDSAQVTTARDMITLGLSLQDNHPRRYGLFKTRRFAYGGKTYKNHNTLLGRTKGVDGIKTGYIRASGFNLVTSMRRDGKHLVAAVFGGKTSSKRNRRMRALLAKHLRKASTRKTRRKRPLLVAARSRAKAPVRRPARVARRAVTSATVAPARARPVYREPTIKVANVRRVDVLGRRNVAVAPPPTPRHANGGMRGRAPSTLQDQLSRLLANSETVQRPNPNGARARRQPVVHQTVSVRPPAAIVPRTRGPAGTFQIQIGAYKTQGEARARLASVASLASSLLQGYRPLTQPVERGRRTLYRARFAGFSAAATARSTCAELKKRAIDCIVSR